MKSAILIGCWLGFVAGAAHAGPTAWVEMTGRGAEARAVTTEAACPPLRVDGRALAMRERSAPSGAFPNRVCGAALPKGARRAAVGKTALPIPKPRPDRLVILGDSGCRLKGAAAQHCNDPTGWPFAKVASLAAARRPDLVIHVGDYYYRETPCPAREAACAGSPFGDRWATWKAELFDPAQPLLAAAPWVFARGNHEDCKRGGAGWFRLLDAAAKPRACPARSDTFAVDVGGVTLFVVDSADTNDIFATAGSVGAFAGGLEPLKSRDRRAPAWIVTHRPVWDAIRFGDILSDGIVNATERAAVRGRDLGGIALILSGHVHNFTALGFGENRPAQLVVGTGGDLMALNDTPPPATGQVKIDGLAARAFTMGRFGYFLFDRKGADWVGTFHDLTDAVAATCRLHGRDLSCVAGR
ncbi:MAG: metallophosphoesterase [Caulobacteraceae bacterium]|nr:metallophosphoesterase [Caulobacteraceae bacterium]